MKKLILATLLIIVTSCNNNYDKQQSQQSEVPELIYETEHCRYYCLQKNGFHACKIVTCDCDAGYSCDASVSW